jgi:hypothetical protein
MTHFPKLEVADSMQSSTLALILTMMHLKREKSHANKTDNSRAISDHGLASRTVSSRARRARRLSRRWGSRRGVGVGSVAGAAGSARGLAGGERLPVAAIRGRDLKAADFAAAGSVDGERNGSLGHGDDGALGRVGDAGGDQGFDAVGDGGQVEVFADAVVADEVGVALGCFEVGGGGVVVLDQSHVELAVLLGQSVVVAAQVHGAVGVGVDDAVVVVFLGPLEDQAAGHDGHFLAVEDGDFVEGTGLDFVAAVLGEEDGDGAVAEHLDELVVAGGLESGVGAAPGVGVQAEEVGAREILVAFVGVVA